MTDTYVSKSLINRTHQGLFASKEFAKNDTIDFFSGKFVEKDVYKNFKEMNGENMFLIDKPTNKFFLISSTKDENNILFKTNKNSIHTGKANYVIVGNNPEYHLKIIPNCKITFQNDMFILIALKSIKKDDEIVVSREASFFKDPLKNYSNKIKRLVNEWLVRNKQLVFSDKPIERSLITIILRSGRKTSFELYISPIHAQSLYYFFKNNDSQLPTTINVFDDMKGNTKSTLKYKKKNNEVLLNEDVKITDVKC